MSDGRIHHFRVAVGNPKSWGRRTEPRFCSVGDVQEDWTGVCNLRSQGGSDLGSLCATFLFSEAVFVKTVCAAILLVCLSVSAFAQFGAPVLDYEAVRKGKIVHAVRTKDRIVLDGKLAEDAWGTAEPATDFLQWEPKPGEPARDRTEVRFLYDDENLYVGATCFDSDPKHLVVNELKEDFQGTESDGLSLTIDSLHDRRSGFIFGTNPAGARRDMQVANDGAQVNMDWDGVWDVKVTVGEQGWFAEFVIPFRTFRFLESDSQDWGVNILRRVRRTNEDSFWAPVPRRYRGTRVSVAGTLTGLEGIHQGRNLKIKPYGIGGVTQTRSSSTTPLVNTANHDGGVDLKYGLTPSLTMDLTYRTDFSQVEVDQQQVNLTRFNVFFPEKREFFLENAATFNMAGGGSGGGGGGENVIPFFSRRVGLSSTGTPIPILGGARVSGRIDKYDVGMFAMKTERLGTTASNNFMAGRVKRNLLKNSWVGALVTSRDSTMAGDFNRVFGADTRFQFFDRLDFDAYLLKSTTPGKSGKDKAGKFLVGWNDNDFQVNAGYQTVETNFNPEVGFVRRKDNSNYSSDATWKPRPKRMKSIRNFIFTSNYDYFAGGLGKVETRSENLHFGILFQNNATLNVSTLDTFDRLVKPFEIRTDIAIPVGDYHYRTRSANFSSDKSRTIALNTAVTTGEFWNGHQVSTNQGLSLKPSYHLNIDLSYNRNRVTLPNGKFTTNLVGSRMLYAFTSRMFLNAFVQYHTDTHQVSSNVRFNVTYRPLSDIYLVWNDRRDTTSHQLLERAFIVKVTRLLNF